MKLSLLLIDFIKLLRFKGELHIGSPDIRELLLVCGNAPGIYDYRDTGNAGMQQEILP